MAVRYPPARLAVFLVFAEKFSLRRRQSSSTYLPGRYLIFPVGNHPYLCPVSRGVRTPQENIFRDTKTKVKAKTSQSSHGYSDIPTFRHSHSHVTAMRRYHELLHRQRVDIAMHSHSTTLRERSTDCLSTLHIGPKPTAITTLCGCVPPTSPIARTPETRECTS